MSKLVPIATIALLGFSLMAGAQQGAMQHDNMKPDAAMQHDGDKKEDATMKQDGEMKDDMNKPGKKAKKEKKDKKSKKKDGAMMSADAMKY